MNTGKVHYHQTFPVKKDWLRCGAARADGTLRQTEFPKRVTCRRCMLSIVKDARDEAEIVQAAREAMK